VIDSNPDDGIVVVLSDESMVVGVVPVAHQ
jgi:hypothetical protein